MRIETVAFPLQTISNHSSKKHQAGPSPKGKGMATFWHLGSHLAFTVRNIGTAAAKVDDSERNK